MRSVRSLVVEPLFHKPIWPLFNVIVTDTYDCYVLCDLMWTKEKVAPNCTHKITAGFSSFSLLLLIIYCFRFFPLLLKCNSPSFISFFPGCSFIYSHLIRLIKKTTTSWFSPFIAIGMKQKLQLKSICKSVKSHPLCRCLCHLFFIQKLVSYWWLAMKIIFSQICVCRSTIIQVI